MLGFLAWLGSRRDFALGRDRGEVIGPVLAEGPGHDGPVLWHTPSDVFAFCDCCGTVADRRRLGPAER